MYLMIKGSLGWLVTEIDILYESVPHSHMWTSCMLSEGLCAGPLTDLLR